MSETNYTLPGLDVEIEDQQMTHGNENTDPNNVLIIGFSDTATTKVSVEPIRIKYSTDFKGGAAIGSYAINNSLSRGFKQIVDACDKGVYVLPLADSIKAKFDTKGDVISTVEDKIGFFHSMQDIFYSIKDNAIFSDIVLKNIYAEHYDLSDEVECISLDYLRTKLSAVEQSKDGTVEIEASAYTNEKMTFDSAELFGDDINKRYFYIAPDAETPADGKVATDRLTIVSGDNKVELVNYAFVIAEKDGENTTIKIVSSSINDEMHYALKNKSVVGYGKDITKKDEDDQDVVVPPSKVNFSIIDMLANFCQEASMRNTQTLGYISVLPSLGTTILEFNEWSKNLKTLDLNGFVQVCATPAVPFGLNGEPYNDTIEAAYCGLVSSLAANISTTNKAIPGVVGVTKSMSANHSAAIARKHYVTLRQKANNYVVADGITAAGSDSYFTRLTTTRITNEVIQQVRAVSDPYIGEPNTVEKRNALEGQINEILSLMQQDGMIQAFKMQLLTTTQDIIDGNIKIALSIVPAFEIRRINLVISLKPSL